jgi:hypothetical protein
VTTGFLAIDPPWGISAYRFTILKTVLTTKYIDVSIANRLNGYREVSRAKPPAIEHDAQQLDPSSLGD